MVSIATRFVTSQGQIVLASWKVEGVGANIVPATWVDLSLASGDSKRYFHGDFDYECACLPHLYPCGGEVLSAMVESCDPTETVLLVFFVYLSFSFQGKIRICPTDLGEPDLSIAVLSLASLPPPLRSGCCTVAM